MRGANKGMDWGEGVCEGIRWRCRGKDYTLRERCIYTTVAVVTGIFFRGGQSHFS